MPIDTAARLRRLLAILAWLAQVGEAPIDETAERFDLTPEALVTELEMAACCGVPPYTPDQLMEIVVTDTTVSVHVGTSLARPRRLSPSEGFALASSVRALLAVPGSDESGALSSALAKLDRALGDEEGRDIEVELDSPTLLPLVRQAVADRRPLRITYYSASTDRVTDREIAPLRIFASEGHWYIDAWCQTAGDLRRFRVDRIGTAETLEHPFPPEAAPAAEPDPGVGPTPTATQKQHPTGRTSPPPWTRSCPVPTAVGCASPWIRRRPGWSSRFLPPVRPRRWATGSRSSCSSGARRGWNVCSSDSVPTPGCSNRPSSGRWPPTPPPGSSSTMAMKTHEN